MNGLKGVNYGKLFTKRKDGVYQKFVNGKYIYSKDPEVLYRKWQAILAGPPEKLVKEVAEEWAKKHREEISVRTWNNYEPHFNDMIAKYGDLKISELTAKSILGHSNITTTMDIYTELRAKQEQRSIDKLNEEMKKYKETC